MSIHLFQLSGRWIKEDGWGILRLLTFEGVVFIPNYSDLHGSPPFPFFWPGAAWDAHFEQTGALFRWGRGILKYFSPKFGELCSLDMETFGPFGGGNFLMGRAPSIKWNKSQESEVSSNKLEMAAERNSIPDILGLIVIHFISVQGGA